MNTPSNNPEHERRRIRYSNGDWWLLDPEQGQCIPLSQKIKQCGWNVGCLCQSLSFGRRTFARLVDEGLGINSKRWLREIRIVAACHLLRENCKIAPVVRELGFHHHSDFTRDFKELVGVSP